MKLYIKTHTEYRVATPTEILSAARKAANKKFRRGQCFRSPDAVMEFLEAKLVGLDEEVFAALWLDNRHRLLQYEEIFQGTVDGTSVYPRVIVKRALEFNAAAVIFAHPHPSGVAEPSQADERITRRLKDALALVDIRVVDHIIVGDPCVSLAARGLV